MDTILLVFAGTGYNREYRGRYARYRVLINGQPLENLYSKEQLNKELSYWSSRSNTMAMTCWGTSQSFEAQLALAGFLKLHQDLRRGHWSEYTRAITEQIKII